VRLRVLPLVLISLAVPGAAVADGLPVLGVEVGGTGVVSPSGEERYVTVPAGDGTVVAQVSTGDGTIQSSRLLPGKLTITAVAYDASASGLSADGKTLVLIEPRKRFPRARTRLAILDVPRLSRRATIDLRGDFSFDAISPHGGLVYLIQYRSKTDPTRYLVRAYDVRAQRLLAAPVVDPREPGEDMRGRPLSRATGRGGRWAYTLYDGAGGTPFVHALDTTRRTARCVDLDDLVSSEIGRARLRLVRGELRVVGGGRVLARVDTRTLEAA
jgi:hypothetical protein